MMDEDSGEVLEDSLITEEVNDDGKVNEVSEESALEELVLHISSTIPSTTASEVEQEDKDYVMVRETGDRERSVKERGQDESVREEDEEEIPLGEILDSASSTSKTDASGLFGGSGGGFESPPKVTAESSKVATSSENFTAKTDASGLFGGSGGGFESPPKVTTESDKMITSPPSASKTDASGLFGGSGGGFESPPKVTAESSKVATSSENFSPKVTTESDKMTTFPHSSASKTDASGLFGGSGGGFESPPKVTAESSKVATSSENFSPKVTTESDKTTTFPHSSASKTDASGLLGGSGGGFESPPKVTAESSKVATSSENFSPKVTTESDKTTTFPHSSASKTDASGLFGGSGGGFESPPKVTAELSKVATSSENFTAKTDASGLFGGSGGGFESPPKVTTESDKTRGSGGDESPPKVTTGSDKTMTSSQSSSTITDASGLFGGSGGGSESSPNVTTESNNTTTFPHSSASKTDASGLFGGSGGGFESSPKVTVESTETPTFPHSSASSGLFGGSGGGFESPPKVTAESSKVATSSENVTAKTDASGLFGGSGGGVESSSKATTESDKTITSPPSASKTDAGGLFGGSGGGFESPPKVTVESIKTTTSSHSSTSKTDASGLFGGSAGGYENSPKVTADSIKTTTTAQPSTSKTDASGLFGGSGGGFDSPPKNVTAESTMTTISPPTSTSKADASGLFGGSCENPPGSVGHMSTRHTTDASSLFGGGEERINGPRSQCSSTATKKKAIVPASDASSLFGVSSTEFGNKSVSLSGKCTQKKTSVAPPSSDASTLFGGTGGPNMFDSHNTSNTVSHKKFSSSSDASSLFGCTGSGGFDFSPPSTSQNFVPPPSLKSSKTIPSSDASGLFGGTGGFEFESSHSTQQNTFTAPPPSLQSSSSLPSNNANSLFGGPVGGHFQKDSQPVKTEPPSSLSMSTTSLNDTTNAVAGSEVAASFTRNIKTQQINDCDSAGGCSDISKSIENVDDKISYSVAEHSVISKKVGPVSTEPLNNEDDEAISLITSPNKTNEQTIPFSSNVSIKESAVQLSNPASEVKPETTGNQIIPNSSNDASALFGGPGGFSNTPVVHQSKQPDASSIFGGQSGGDDSSGDVFANSSPAPNPSSSTPIRKGPSSGSKIFKGATTNAVPDNLFSSPDDMFSTGPFGNSFAPGPNDLFGAPPPSSHPPGSRLSRPTTATEVFDRPALQSVVVDQNAPPSAPGVRQVIPQQHTSTPPPSSLPNTHTSPSVQRDKKKVVPPKPKQKASMHPSQMAFANIPKGDNKTPDSLNVFNAAPKSSTPAGTVNRLRPSGPYKPAVGPIVNFGFGGRLVTFFPGAAVGGNVPSLQQAPGSGNKPSRPCPLTVHTVNRLVANNQLKESAFHGGKNDISGISSVGSSPDAVRRHEVKQLFELMTGFGGPLESEDLEKKKALIENFISTCQANPVGYTTSSLGAKNASQPSSETLLWSLLQIMLKFGGSLSSENLVDGKDVSTPEAHIVRLLLEGSTIDNETVDKSLSPMYPRDSAVSEDAISQQMYLNHLNSRTASQQNAFNGPFAKPNSSSTEKSKSLSPQEKNIEDANFYSKVEQLLIRGKREDACAMAVEAEQWPVALMIGSMCGKDAFQHMMKAMAEKNFPQQSTLHLMSLLYSNQAESIVRYGGRSLAGNKTTNETSGVTATWKRNLAAIVANKVGDWNALSKAVGDRIMESSSDIMAAHFAYLVSGIPCGKGKITLLGCDNMLLSTAEGRVSMGDLRVLSAMRMTEIYEWCIVNGGQKFNVKDASSNSSPGKKQSTKSSFSSFFGLGGGSSQENDSNDEIIQSLPTTSLKKLPADIVMKCRIALCPYKLKLALLLADMGLVEDAAGYVREIKAVCAQAENSSAGNKKPGMLKFVNVGSCIAVRYF